MGKQKATYNHNSFKFTGRFELCTLLRFYNNILNRLIVEDPTGLLLDEKPRFPIFKKFDDIPVGVAQDYCHLQIFETYDPHLYLYSLFHYQALLQYTLPSVKKGVKQVVTNKNRYYHARYLLALFCGMIQSKQVEEYLNDSDPDEAENIDQQPDRNDIRESPTKKQRSHSSSQSSTLEDDEDEDYYSEDMNYPFPVDKRKGIPFDNWLSDNINNLSYESDDFPFSPTQVSEIMPILEVGLDGLTQPLHESKFCNFVISHINDIAVLHVNVFISNNWLPEQTHTTFPDVGQITIDGSISDDEESETPESLHHQHTNQSDKICNVSPKLTSGKTAVQTSSSHTVTVKSEQAVSSHTITRNPETLSDSDIRRLNATLRQEMRVTSEHLSSEFIAGVSKHSMTMFLVIQNMTQLAKAKKHCVERKYMSWIQETYSRLINDIVELPKVVDLTKTVTDTRVGKHNNPKTRTKANKNPKGTPVHKGKKRKNQDIDSDSDTGILESIRRFPESKGKSGTSRKGPGIKTLESKKNSRTPKGIPETPEGIPETLGKIHETSGKIPESEKGSEIPLRIPVPPEIPKTPKGIPETPEGIPETPGKIHETPGKIPESGKDSEIPPRIPETNTGSKTSISSEPSKGHQTKVPQSLGKTSSIDYLCHDIKYSYDFDAKAFNEGARWKQSVVELARHNSQNPEKVNSVTASVTERPIMITSTILKQLGEEFPNDSSAIFRLFLGSKLFKRYYD